MGGTDAGRCIKEVAIGTQKRQWSPLFCKELLDAMFSNLRIYLVLFYLYLLLSERSDKINIIGT